MAYGKLLTPEQVDWMIREEQRKEEKQRSIAKEIADMKSGTCLEFEAEDLKIALGAYLLLVIERVPGGTKKYRVIEGASSILVYKYKPGEEGGKLW